MTTEHGPALVVALAVLGGCGSGAAGDAGNPGISYLTDAAARRAALVRSLVNPSNCYSALRLAHYDTGDDADWSRLPESNPRVEQVSESEVLQPGGVVLGARVGPGAQALSVSAAASAGDPDALRALGREAFFRYPVQASVTVATAMRSGAAFSTYGFWLDGTYGAGGVVREETAHGAAAFAFTCSTCHASSRDGSLVIGLGNERLDLGRLAVDASVGASPTIAARLLGWGPGRLDVTTADGTEPVRIADVRPTSWLTYLQADATVQNDDIAALAIRLETLIITSHNLADRPPRAVTLGLAMYLDTLASTLPDAPPKTAEEIHGAELFESSCSRCHAPVSLTGPPVSLSVVGTDPSLGLSPERTTGKYRVPSLHGVGSRGSLLHDGSLPSLGAMFDPSRLEESYTAGRIGIGPVKGHLFGLDLDAEDRADLVAYLSTL
jgi:mono/diheme cytochrome c family protein